MRTRGRGPRRSSEVNPWLGRCRTRASLTCKSGLVDCETSFTLDVQNCSALAVTLNGWSSVCTDPQAYGAYPLYLPSMGGERIRLRPGEAWTATLTRYVAETCTFHANLVGDGAEVGAVPITVQVVNPAADASIAACRACGGEWGRQGMLQRYGCVCPTPDAGKPCAHADDCTVGCISRGGEPFRCAETDSPFGCFTILPDRGQADQSPQLRCVD
ncbi:MAG: hypothetical protein ABMB14_26725 [Myxococcota bacterium]